ncbi:DUF6445 family protein [Alterisphingorhabdus coralli]|uniref:DUF6445 family protein n=1 Tax=Alterisphingorhabdus coralli TaxID=3071408 RepID=A0AA97F978_9SPHN|nr:DUF6445 family protein [Parasphingorhabdus sp. SCSIO 66989]WOE75592.1 DUF6445 family protein [Parasphingorhabdus sp. SCSIO 66989]
MSLPSLIVIDDFLADPHAVRRQALGLSYNPANKRGNYPGITSDEALDVAALNDKLSRLVDMQVAGDPDTLHGHCRITKKADKGATGVHIDPADYSGILYLSEEPQDRSGTCFFRHKPTGLERIPTTPVALAKSGYADPSVAVEQIVNTDTNKPARWEKVMTVPMRFNRLVLFSPWMFHDAGPGFGKTQEDARLVMLLFLKKQR